MCFQVADNALYTLLGLDALKELGIIPKNFPEIEVEVEVEVEAMKVEVEATEVKAKVD